MKAEAAALTGSLLARKGAATPSRLFAVPVRPAPAPVATDHGAKDTGPAGDRRRLTLRLDHHRHMRLKLAAAHLDLSLQDILIAALDAYLAREAPCACLAGETK